MFDGAIFARDPHISNNCKTEPIHINLMVEFGEWRAVEYIRMDLVKCLWMYLYSHLYVRLYVVCEKVRLKGKNNIHKLKQDEALKYVGKFLDKIR